MRIEYPPISNGPEKKKAKKRPRGPETSPRFEWFEISAEEVIQILKSKDFLDALKTAAECTHESGHETSFSVFISTSDPKKILLSEVLEGLTDMVSPLEYPTETKVIREGISINLPPNFVTLIGFHFHPEPKGSIAPSKCDLVVFENIDLFETFLAIGQVNEKGDKIKILLIWLKMYPPLGMPLEDKEKLKIEKNQEEIINILRENNLEAVIIEFERIGNTYQLSQESEEKLRNYGSFRVLIPKNYL